jgi:hypothetical protein
MATAKLNQWFRAKTKVIFIIICVVIMVVWFVPIDRLLEGTGGTKGTIFGEGVPAGTVDSLAHMLFYLGGQQGRDAQYLAYAQTWESLILAHEAESYGINVSDEDIRTALMGRFASAQGGLDMDVYGAFLAEIQTPRPQFEKGLRTFIAANKMLAVVRDSMLMTEDEAWLWYARDKQWAKAAYIQLRGEDFAPFVSLNPEEIQRFYQTYADRDPDMDPNGVGYLQPERVKIEYVMLPFAGILDTVEVTDEEVGKYYEEHKEEYKLGKASTAPADAPDEYTPLETVAADIKGKLRLDKAKTVAAVRMKEVNEEIWKRLDVPFGSEEVRNVELAEIATQFGLECKTTDFFTADQAGQVIPGGEVLARLAFGRGTGGTYRPSAPLNGNDGMFIFQIVESHPAQAAPYEDVKLQVAKDYQMEQGLNLAMEIAAKAAEAPTLDAATEIIKTEAAALIEEKGDTEAKPQDFYVRGESDYFSRPSEIWGQRYARFTGLPGNFNYVNFADRAFALKEGETAMAVEPEGSRAAFVLRRIGTRPADRAEFEKNKDNIIRQISQQKAEAHLLTWFEDVRRRARPSEEVMKFLQFLPQWAAAPTGKG